MSHYLEVQLDVENIGIPNSDDYVTRRFNNLSEDFIIGALTILDSLSYDNTTYKTDIGKSYNLTLCQNCGRSYDLLISVLDFQCPYGNSRRDVHNPCNSNESWINIHNANWKTFIQSRVNIDVKKYTAKVMCCNANVLDIIQFSTLDYLSGIYSANQWISRSNARIIDVYQDFKLCKMGCIFHNDVIDNEMLEYQKEFNSILLEHLILDICSIIFGYYQNICEWIQFPYERYQCVSECGGYDRCMFHRGLIKDKSSLICKVVII